MEPIKFYRCFALVPVLAAVLACGLGWIFPESLPEPLRGVQFLIAMSVVGLPIYVPFAVLIYWLLRHRPPESHRRWSYWVPLPFALLVFVVWFLFFVPRFPLPARAEKSLGAAAFGACLGYIYVLLMHVSFTVGRRLGVSRAPEAAA